MDIESVEKTLCELWATVNEAFLSVANVMTDFCKVDLIKWVYQSGLVNGRVYYLSRTGKPRTRKKQRVRVRKELKKFIKRRKYQ